MRVTAVGIGNLGLALALLCVCAGCELSRIVLDPAWLESRR